MVAGKYYWPGLSSDVCAYVITTPKHVWRSTGKRFTGLWDRCQRKNKKLQKAAGGLHPIPVQPKLWHQVGMDLIGPMPETPRGNKYIITLTDHFSKWAEQLPFLIKWQKELPGSFTP